VETQPAFRRFAIVSPRHPTEAGSADCQQSVPSGIRPPERSLLAFTLPGMHDFIGRQA
jgi:hypothetical protein